MPYNSEVYDAVLAQFAQRRAQAKDKLQAVKDKLYAEIPELARLETELAETAPKLAKAMLSARSEQEINDLIAKLKKENLELQRQRCELLVGHGYPMNALEPKFECRHCKDEGFIGSEMCSCFKTALKKESYKRLGFGATMDKQTFDSFDLSYYSDTPDQKLGISPRKNMENIFVYCKKFAKNISQPGQGILMMGQTGLGKTFLSVAIARAAAEAGHTVVYDTAQNIFRAYEDERFGRNGQAAEKVAAFMDADLLIIDDLGAEFVTQFSISCLYNILSSRGIASKKLAINTNLTPTELEATYSPRIMSRLIGEFAILHFVGQDIRQLKLKR